MGHAAVIPSPAGLTVCLLILLVGWFHRAPLLVALFISIPFGSTAFAYLTMLGNSTPLIYALLALLMLGAMLLRENVTMDLGTVLRRHASAWVVIGLAVYAIGSSIILPRLFIGQTTAFVVFRGGIYEIPLAPHSGNTTQTAYFVLGAMVYFSVMVLMLKQSNWASARAGLFLLVAGNATLGLLDLSGKLLGLGDLLDLIRTVNYSLLTEVSEGGFWRVVGGYAEASSFAIGTMSCLAFAYTYWRVTGDRAALMLATISLVLLILSTSTTAYGGLGILGLILAFSMLPNVLRGRITPRDLTAFIAVIFMFAGILAAYAWRPALFDPFIDLFNSVIVNKAQSQSGQERAYWNGRSIAALFDTMGLGVGMGSSRASSWIVSVLSQLGVLGSTLMCALVVDLLRGTGKATALHADPQVLGLFRGARACGFAFLIGASLSGGSADPGILFFMCLAISVSLRHWLMSQVRTRTSGAALAASGRLRLAET